MDSREIIRRVLDYEAPPRIGMNYSPWGEAPRLDDLAFAGPSGPDNAWTPDGAGGEVQTDEWGNVWRRLPERTSGGEVLRPALPTWEALDTYQPPDLAHPARYQDAARVREQHPDRYLLGGVEGAGFATARYLRRMEQYLCDCAESPEQVARLNLMVNDLALAEVDRWAEVGADGVFFCEDWGTEERLLVSPRMWREQFALLYERLISQAHARGLTVWMHSCGYIKDIIPPLVEMGLDVLQLDQPELNGLEFLAQFSGRVTYWCPVDIQKILPTGDRELIQGRAREMLRRLAARGGGFIAKDYPDNASLGVDPLWQQWGYEVFAAEGAYPPG